MAGRRVDRLGKARRRSIPSAVVRRAEMRPAFDHLARNPDLGFSRIEAVGLVAAPRIVRGAARRALALRPEPRHVPVGRPLPYVAGNVDQTVAVGGNAPTGDVPSKPSSFRFCQGNSPCQKFAINLPSTRRSVPHAYSAPSRPPRAANSHSASVGSVLPAQRGVRLRIREGNLHDRMLLTSFESRVSGRADGASRHRG